MAHVLILDGEQGDRDFLSEALSVSGYRVLTVADLEEARELLAEALFDLYVLHVRYVGGTALDFIPAIRRQKRDAGIIVLTDVDSESDRVLGLELGADDCLVKPVGAREIQARAKAVLRRASWRDWDESSPNAGGETEYSATLIPFHGLLLNPASRTLTSASTSLPVSLTNMEFDVLAALAQNRNRVMSREEIVQLIRGRDWANDDRAVDGIISRLRRKLYEDRDGAHHIKTIRGIGYMLAVQG